MCNVLLGRDGRDVPCAVRCDARWTDKDEQDTTMMIMVLMNSVMDGGVHGLMGLVVYDNTLHVVTAAAATAAAATTTTRRHGNVPLASVILPFHRALFGTCS